MVDCRKNAGRWKDGTERRSQKVTHRDGERSQRERAPPLYGADSAGVGRRRAAAGRTGVGMESWDDPQRSTRTGTRDYLHQCIRITRPQTESKSTSPTYSAISLPLWTGRVKPTHNARTNRLYTRLTATEVRRQLIGTFGYREDELPTAETIATKLNELGYALKKVAKSQPQKNCPKPMPSLPKSSTEMRRQMPLPTCYGSQWMPRQRLRSAPLHVEERVASQPRLLTMTFSQKQL